MWLKVSQKTGKHCIVASVSRCSWWMPHWIKFRIFSSLERWKWHFQDKITKKFWCGGRCNAKLNYLKVTAIICTIQPLLLNINKLHLNLKGLVSDLLFFVFQFHIHLPKYGFGNTLHAPRRIKVSSKFIFWSTKSFLRTLRRNQIRTFFGTKTLVYLVSNLFMADAILLAYTPTPDLT